jgi:hypothetical protein
MARSVRVEFPGAFYHVMARGNRRNPSSTVKEDVSRFAHCPPISPTEERHQIAKGELSRRQALDRDFGMTVSLLISCGRFAAE